MSDASDIGRHIEGVARALWGEPNDRLSSPAELRWGSYGSRSVRLDKGTWFDNEEKVGGGVIDLVRRETGRANGAAFDWLREHGFDVGEDVRAPKARAGGGDGKQRRVVKRWDYVDETGELLFQVERLEDAAGRKSYRQRRPDGQGGWVYSVKGSRLVPYRLPELLEVLAEDRLVFIVEGEKCADRLWAEGVPATCNPMGAGKWPAEFAEHFAGAHVVILPDNDDPGRKHRDLAAANLAPVAASVRVLDLPGLAPKGDSFDWQEAGGTAAELYDLVERQARPWVPGEQPSRFGAVWFADIDREPPRRDWIVKGLLGVGEMGVLWGFSGSGKSFLALDLTLTVAHAATGRELEPKWFGHKVLPGGVVYVAPEGGQDLRLRIRAWREARGVPAGTPLPFVLLPTSIDLVSPDADVGPLIDEIRMHAARMSAPLRIVAIDTLARSVGGGNENAPEVMGAFIRSCERIQKETGAHALPIHHAGNDKTKERGHTSLRAAVDASIEVAKPDDGGPNSWTVRKLKSGIEGTTHHFRLQQIAIGVDDDGDPITSCVVVPSETGMDSASRGRRSKPISREGRMALRALHDALADHGEAAPPGIGLPYGIRVVKRDHWRPRLVGALVDPDEDPTSDKIRQRLRRARIELEDARVIGHEEPYFWIIREPST